MTVLSTADFHSSVWTNKQYMAVGLAEHTKVSYIESMGLRAPTVSKADLARLASRVGRSLRRSGGEISVPNVRIFSPKVIPYHGAGVVRAINRRLVSATLARQLEPTPGSVLWTFSPLTYGLEDFHSRVVYHSVDLLHTLPGVPREALLAAEAQLIARADHVIASSAGVANHLTELGGRPQVWQNVADVKRFSSAASLERDDRVVFAGNLTPTKVDFQLVKGLVNSGIKVRLAGPVSIDGVSGENELQKLLSHPNVEYLGRLSLDQLAAVCGRAKVGIIPYHINEYTSGVFPLKVYEYMAAGMAVVCTPIESVVAANPEGVVIAESENFSAEVADVLQNWTVDQSAMLSRLAEGHSWSGRIEQARGLLVGDRSS
ncbi:glycosyltransferase [Rhodococcus indonesiensis]|uniref:glycosyltransferase n=1 Tax=Rhodococcus indonesiensis TaxID=3055869 RepID=UPI0039F705E0